ncbi:DUF86 domain-containing protein [Candidatus Woesearchaeota archaeon]|nr:DUF86 domain-containing protein [Candidatus Woesearchaeota archaeon]
MSNTKIQQKISEIKTNILVIQENMPDSFKEFQGIGLIKDGIYKRLEFCIQNLIDIFSMFYIAKHLGVPGSIEEILLTLENRKIISKKNIKLIQEMKGLRNILVHIYGNIDDRKMYDHLQHLDDFEMILKEIEEIVNNNGK